MNCNGWVQWLYVKAVLCYDLLKILKTFYFQNTITFLKQSFLDNFKFLYETLFVLIKTQLLLTSIGLTFSSLKQKVHLILVH